MSTAWVRAEVARCWPELPPPDEELEAFFHRRSEAAGGAQLQWADLFLAYHALRGHGRALAALQAQLEKLRPILVRTGADGALIDEVLGELPSELVAPRHGAAARLAAYAGRGPLGGWLRVVAVRTLLERKRRVRARTDEGALAQLAAVEPGPEAMLLRLRCRDELVAAVTASVAALSPRQRQLLRQHYLDGLSIDELASQHGIHRATAARRLVKLREELAQAVRSALVTKLGIGDSTLDSLVGAVVGGELELRLDRVL